MIKSAIGFAKKYISKEEIIDVKDKIIITCFLKWKILVHFFWDANDAIKRIEAVSNPNLANRVKSRKTVIART